MTRLCAIVPAVLAAMLAGPATGAASERPMAAFAGVWKMDAARSKMERAGPGGAQTVRSDSFTWVFRPVGRGMELDIYHAYPAPAPSKVMAVVTDGQFHPCRMDESCLSTPGDPKEQSFAFRQVDARMATRVFRIRGQISEYNSYSLSADGRTFVAISWSPATPEYRNFQVFERQR